MPLRQTVAGAWKVAKGSRLKREDGEVGHKNARMRKRESVGQIPSTLSTLVMFGKTSCATLDVRTPLRDLPQQWHRGARARLPVSMGQPIGKPRM
jgi:hypothetical protein